MKSIFLFLMILTLHVHAQEFDAVNEKENAVAPVSRTARSCIENNPEPNCRCYYTVRSGDFLSAIARELLRYSRDYVCLFTLARLKYQQGGSLAYLSEPNKIKPNDKLCIPQKSYCKQISGKYAFYALNENMKFLFSKNVIKKISKGLILNDPSVFIDDRNLSGFIIKPDIKFDIQLYDGQNHQPQKIEQAFGLVAKIPYLTLSTPNLGEKVQNLVNLIKVDFGPPQVALLSCINNQLFPSPVHQTIYDVIERSIKAVSGAEVLGQFSDCNKEALLKQLQKIKLDHPEFMLLTFGIGSENTAKQFINTLQQAAFSNPILLVNLAYSVCQWDTKKKDCHKLYSIDVTNEATFLDTLIQ